MLDAIVISDIHLGSRVCQAERLSNFLDSLPPTRQLVINGDLLDGKLECLSRSHWCIPWQLRDLQQRCLVTWVRGNHDQEAEHLEWLLPAAVDEHLIATNSASFLCVHGDRWDRVIKEHPGLSTAADWLYSIMQRINLSWARGLKQKTQTVRHVCDMVRQGALALGKERGVEWVLCGHTHHAEIGAGFANSGCWTEDDVTYLTIYGSNIRLCHYPAKC